LNASRRNIKNVSPNIVLAKTTQTMAAHARCFHLGSRSRNAKFLKCVERLALSNNVSTVLLATDAKDFQGVGVGKGEHPVAPAVSFNKLPQLAGMQTMVHSPYQQRKYLERRGGVPLAPSRPGCAQFGIISTFSRTLFFTTRAAAANPLLFCWFAALQFAETMLGPKGVRMISMEGVERLGEGAPMRNTLQKIQVSQVASSAPNPINAVVVVEVI